GRSGPRRGPGELCRKTQWGKASEGHPLIVVARAVNCGGSPTPRPLVNQAVCSGRFVIAITGQGDHNSLVTIAAEWPWTRRSGGTRYVCDLVGRWYFDRRRRRGVDRVLHSDQRVARWPCHDHFRW